MSFTEDVEIDKHALDEEYLKQLLHYDKLTGIFTWLINKGTKFNKGKEAGTRSPQGYIYIKIDGIRYIASRLAWLYVYGYFPEGLVEHRDQIKHHNWIDNLREASHSCNMKNIGTHYGNTSGVKGVSWNKSKNKYVVQIQINGINKHIAYSTDKTEAVAHRFAAEQCVDWQDCDSNSPAYQYMKEVLNVV